MKNAFLVIVTLLVCASAEAATGEAESLRAYAQHALPRCQDGIVTLEPAPQQGPQNFHLYIVGVKSPDESCATRKYLMYSPTTQQVIIGSLILVPPSNEPVAVRVSNHATKLMDSPVQAVLAPFPLPDGLKGVSLLKNTTAGPFAYHGFIDASDQYLIIGSRGNLRTDPARTLRDSLGIENGVRRGNTAAKVEIIELSDFECPTCARAHKEIEPVIEKNLSKINYIRMDLPLFEHHEWAVPAALGAHAVHKVAPSKYWDYVNFVFTNQEAIGKMPFERFFHDFCEDHDIPWAKAEKVFKSPTERQSILESASRAFDLGVMATPTYIINGQMMGFGPGGSYVLQQIKSAVGAK